MMASIAVAVWLVALSLSGQGLREAAVEEFVSSAPQAAVQSSAQGPARISGGIWEKQIIPDSKIQPIYPQAAKDAHISGAVVMDAVIGVDGAVRTLQVISGPAELRAAALDAVKQWRYKVYHLNGEPHEVQTTVTVNFTLQP
jgi:protein TonB